MKSYTFSGNYKKNNEKEAFFTNIPFIETQVVPTLKQLQFSGKLPKELHFLDTSCGDNRVVEKLSNNDIIKTFVLYDLFFTFENSFQKDWLREKYKKTNKKINLIGFNPPYGFNATTAKQFISKGFNENYEYCVWLVPISLEKYLESLYNPIFKKQYCNELFENKKDDAKVKTIKQSVVLFIGKKREKQIILSGKKVEKLNIKGIKITRGHYKGINENVDVIIKKTGNPVLIPFFVKNKDNTWTQFNKDGIVSREVPLIEKENGYYITGISKTKHTTKLYDYSVDSNIYFKLENVKNTVDINLFIKELLETANKEEFYVFTNRYKPASITKGWFENFIFNFITKCK